MKTNVRENRRCNQKRTIQRKQKGQSKMNNPEKTEGAIKNEQSRDTGNIGYTGRKQTNKQKNKTQKTKRMSNTDPTKTQR